MTQLNDNQIMEIFQEALNKDEDFMKMLMQTIVQKILEMERDAQIGAESYERNKERAGSRNGYKSRSLKTRLGKMKLEKPQIREYPFKTAVFTNYQRSEKALIIAIREMVINGVSTPKVKKITGKLSEGLTYSKSTVSRMMKELDPMISQWRGRQLLDYYVYMISDATYFYVRENDKVVSMPLLITIGIDKSGHRSILGADMAITECEESWREHHRKIKARGVDKVGLTISDAKKGLMTVLNEEYSGAPHQRCKVHFMRNLLSKVPRKEREALADYAKQIFSSGKLSMALKIAEMISDEYRDKYPAVSRLLDEHVEEALAYYNFPRKHWKKIRTSNLIEGTLNTILKRRSKAVGIFPNRESCIRYACSLLMEISEDWETGRRYMIIEDQDNQENDKLLDEIKETKQEKELVAL